MTKLAMPRVFAKDRPSALHMPGDRTIQALTKPEVFDRWSQDAAGVRALQAGDNVITMFDIIGEDFWSGGGVTAKRVASQLRAIGDRPVEVHINSGGGDMFEGIAIYNVLREHPQNITIKVMGMAASAASIIAMAGDTVEIGAASFLMIHNCWVVAMGNRHDMAETAAWLEPFDRAMADVYAQRTGTDAKAISDWMDKETYMSGSLAIERGFADTLLPADAVTTDTKAQASEREINKLRATEIALMASGLSRSQARARVNELRGTTDSAPPPGGTTDSADEDLRGDLAALLASMK